MLEYLIYTAFLEVFMKGTNIQIIYSAVIVNADSKDELGKVSFESDPMNLSGYVVHTTPNDILKSVSIWEQQQIKSNRLMSQLVHNEIQSALSSGSNSKKNS